MACEKMDEVVSPDVEQQQDPLADVIRIAMDGASMLEDGATRATANRRVNLDAISCKIHPATRAGEANDTLYYVVNYADNAGFAIVSADEHATDGERLIAVTESGSYTAGDRTSNEGFNLYMEVVEDVICDQTLGAPGFIPDLDLSWYETVDTYSNWVTKGPYVTVEWGQGDTSWFDSENFVSHPNEYNPAYPYNKYCYKEEGDSICPAGCAIVAVAQIMSYHQKPTSYYKTYDENRVLKTISWNNFLSSGGVGFVWNSDVADEIAHFFAEIGHLCDATYTPNGTSAYASDAINALESFGYGPISLVNYDFTTIQNELNNARPTYMRGTREVVKSNGDISYIGHAWVVDGYKTCVCTTSEYRVYPATVDQLERRVLIGETESMRYYLHCNWGYDGDCNGYFKHNYFCLNSAKEEAGGFDNPNLSNSNSRNYTLQWYIMTGIK